MADILGFALDKIENDLTFLMACFDDVLTSIGEPDRARRLRFVREAGDPGDLRVRDARDAAALSLAFQALNLVEENASAQSRRLRETTEGLAREPGLWGQNLRQLVASGATGREIADLLREVRVEPVLTAHPTEAKPADVIAQQRSLYLLLVRRENTMWTPSERADIDDEIQVMLERLWRTAEFLEKKPEVKDERANALHYLRNVFPQVLPWLDARLRHAWADAGLDASLLDEAQPVLAFGTWIGGDRDGHPLVTGAVTRDTLKELRDAALGLHAENLARLARDLPLSARLQSAPPSLESALGLLRAAVGDDAARAAAAAHPSEPWRELVDLIRARLPSYARREELLADLEALARSLADVGAKRVARASVAPVIRAVRVFGLHLAALDVRQNSAYHDRAVTQLFAAAGVDASGFDEWDEPRRRELLDRELASPRPLAPIGTPLGGEAEGAVDALRALAEARAAHGAEGLGAIIVSMTRDVSDLLVVYLLAREVGLLAPCPGGGGGMCCALPVVPLFETLDDLEAAPRIMAGFLDHPVTRASLGKDACVQIMLGYSDSCKDAGILASQFALHRAQRELTEVVQKRGMRVRFFHGRGGTVSRGAGPTHRFLEALPAGSLSGDVRVTEQGETIAQKYANRITATYHLELLLAGVTATTLRHRAGTRSPGAADPALDALLERLAGVSRDVYRALVTDDAFLPYFAEATPIDALEQARIGSRPARRSGRRTLEDLRAIPWVFAWNQSRHYLPGWYGLGSAIDAVTKDDAAALERLRTAAREDPFFQYVLKNVESAVASTALDVAASYASLVHDAKVRERILGFVREEHARTAAAIEALFGEPLERRRPRMWRTLRLRDQGLRALHAYQVDMLARWRGGAQALLPSVLVSLNAIASGLRTTG